MSALATLLEKAGIEPVLVDIGCSGARYAVWDPIAKQSTMIGFDPDSRELPSGLRGRYKNAVMVDRAVCDNDTVETVEFILTQYPYCSSTLPPDLDALDDYVFRSYFTPVSKATVPATSLKRVLAQHGLEGIDWLKVDSQGTDLRIIRSLGEEPMSRLVAVDIEPGLISAYQGEDLFVDVHRFLVSKGFWLSDLQLQAYPRVRETSLSALAALTEGELPEDTIRKVLKGSPTAAEARYLRTIPVAAEGGRRQLALLFVFAILDKQVGFAFEVFETYRQRFADDETANFMETVVKEGLDTLRHGPSAALAAQSVSGMARSLTYEILRRTYHRLSPFWQRLARQVYESVRPS